MKEAVVPRWIAPADRFIRRRPVLAAFAGYVLLALISSFHIVVGDRSLGPERVLDGDGFYGMGVGPKRFYDDPTPILIDYPRDLTIARSLQTVWPFAWNPWVGTGAPLAAEQGGAFFPLRLPFYIYPRPATYTLFRLSRLVLAALGAYALARARGRSRWASFVAGGLFELAGNLIWMAAFAATSAVYVLPWLLLGINFLFGGKRARPPVAVDAAAASDAPTATDAQAAPAPTAAPDPAAAVSAPAAVAITAGSTGLILLGFHPGVTAVALVAALAAFLGGCLENVRRPRLIARATGLAAAAVALGALISACGVLPFLELLSQGESYKNTMGPQIWTHSAFYSKSTWWPGTFAPLLVDPLRDKYPEYPFTLNALYGLAGLFLALVAAQARRLDRSMLVVFAFGIVFSFVPPGFTWLKALPFVQHVLPRYCFVMLTLPITQWAATGLELLFARQGRAQSRAILVAALAFLGLGGLTALAMHADFRALVWPLLSESFLYWIPYLAIPALVAAAVLLGRRLRPAWGRVALGLTALCELAAYDTQHLAEPASRTLRRGRAPTSLETAHLTQETHSRMASTEFVLGFPQFNLLDRLHDFRMTSALAPRRYYHYLRLLGAGDFVFYGPGVTVSPLLDIAAVRYFASSFPDRSMPKVAEARARYVFLNEEALPRARLVPGTVVVGREEEAHAWLKAFGALKLHVSQSFLKDWAVVEAAAGDPAPPRLFGQHAGGTVEFVKDLPDHVELSVYTAAPSLLVLADTHYPGWRATVDDRPAHIYPTNLLFRGVAVPAGRHTVRFDYRPASLGVGLLLSAAGTLAVAGLAAADVRRRRRQRRRGAPLPA